MIELELKGETPVNRPAHVGAKARRVKKILAKSSWFKKKSGQNTTSGQTGKPKPKDPPPETRYIHNMITVNILNYDVARNNIPNSLARNANVK